MVKAGVMPCPVDFQKLKIKMLTSGRNRNTASHNVAGAMRIGTGKPGSRRYLRLTSASAATGGALPINPRCGATSVSLA
jgi:hypothetical protein